MCLRIVKKKAGGCVQDCMNAPLGLTTLVYAQ